MLNVDLDRSSWAVSVMKSDVGDSSLELESYSYKAQCLGRKETHLLISSKNKFILNVSFLNLVVNL